MGGCGNSTIEPEGKPRGKNSMIVLFSFTRNHLNSLTELLPEMVLYLIPIPMLAKQPLMPSENNFTEPIIRINNYFPKNNIK